MYLACVYAVHLKRCVYFLPCSGLAEMTKRKVEVVVGAPHIRIKWRRYCPLERVRRKSRRNWNRRCRSAEKKCEHTN